VLFEIDRPVIEIGRSDYMARSGFIEQARKKKWYLSTRSINVKFIGFI
jgi:hypothetical protein